MDEREFELVNILGANLGANQRQLSHLMSLSLGQTNMLIRRLLSKGYIRITQLNQKKVSYLLTPKGIQEKVNKSIKYTLKTINSISLIRAKTKDIIQVLYQQGHRCFYIVGRSDFALLIEMVIKASELEGCDVKYVDEDYSQISSGIILFCKENIPVKKPENVPFIDLLYELSKDGTLNLLGSQERVAALKEGLK